MTGLYDFQSEALGRVSGRHRCALYHDMGLGKTFTGTAKMDSEGRRLNLVVCQASKVRDWVDHLSEHCPEWLVCSLQGKAEACHGTLSTMRGFDGRSVAVITYDTLINRPRVVEFPFECVLFDESSLLQNPCAKRTKAAMRLADRATSVVLLSGTPTDGKYERLWTQMRMLGWTISERAFWSTYVDYEVDRSQGFPVTKVRGYRNVGRLRRKMREAGCDFLKTSEVIDLPEQTFVTLRVPMTPECRAFRRDRVLEAFGRPFVGDSALGALTCERQLAGAYSDPKLRALGELLDGTRERVVVFYNFDAEREAISQLLEMRGRPQSLVCGRTKRLESFEECDDGVAVIQYQAGAMGLNLQAAHYVVYFSPPLASSLYEQSKKRVHRVGQTVPCTYYRLVTEGSVEERVYSTLALRRDYTERLFEREARDGR